MISCSCSNFAVSSGMLPLGPFKARVVCVRPTHMGLSFWNICCRWSMFDYGDVDVAVVSRLRAKLLTGEIGSGTRQFNNRHTAQGRISENGVRLWHINSAARVSIHKHFRVLGWYCRLESRWCLRRERCLPKFNTPGDHSATPSSITLQRLPLAQSHAAAHHLRFQDHTSVLHIHDTHHDIAITMAPNGATSRKGAHIPGLL